MGVKLFHRSTTFDLTGSSALVWWKTLENRLSFSHPGRRFVSTDRSPFSNRTRNYAVSSNLDINAAEAGFTDRLHQRTDSGQYVDIYDSLK